MSSLSGGTSPWPWALRIDVAKQCFDWQAWTANVDGSTELHVVGNIMVSNPDIAPVLTKRVPQGTNPHILILDLTFKETAGGQAAQGAVWAQANFFEVIKAADYTSVDIQLSGKPLAKIDEISQYGRGLRAAYTSPINGTPINTQNPSWQHMVTAPADKEKAVQIIGQWINHNVLQPATFSIFVEIRGPGGFVFQKFPNDASVHKVPPAHSAWVRLADNPNDYSDNDTYWPDPLRFVAGDPY